MQQIDTIQFLPYFPPHSGGLETHAKQRGEHRAGSNYGRVCNLFSSVDQGDTLTDIPADQLISTDTDTVLGYHAAGIDHLIIPTFELIPGFPVPLFWTRQYHAILRYLRDWSTDQTVVVTRTRFFLTSFLGGVVAKRFGLPRVHIEHGSAYVQLSNRLLTWSARLYDQLLGSRVFRQATSVVPISHACKEFIESKFSGVTIGPVIYRGLAIDQQQLATTQVERLADRFPHKTIIGFVGRLYERKNVGSLITAWYAMPDHIRNKTQLVVIGDGVDRPRIEQLDRDNCVNFTGEVSFYEALAYQQQFDIHVHSSSPGGGLASTLLQAIYFGVPIVATPYEGAAEVITDGENGILLDDDSVEELQRGLKELLKTLPDQQEAFATRNKQLAQQLFDRNVNIGLYFNLFSSLVDIDER